MRLYVASSWRNPLQPGVVEGLRAAGHEVYDFRNPPNRAGFGWEQIHKDWLHWTAEEYLAALRHPLAEAGFRSDMDALRQCEACVLVLPCGRSAHLEAGFAAGAGKPVVILTRDGEEPELMYKMAAAVVTSLEGVRQALAVLPLREEGSP